MLFRAEISTNCLFVCVLDDDAAIQTNVTGMCIILFTAYYLYEYLFDRFYFIIKHILVLFIVNQLSKVDLTGTSLCSSRREHICVHRY